MDFVLRLRRTKAASSHVLLLVMGCRSCIRHERTWTVRIDGSFCYVRSHTIRNGYTSPFYHQKNTFDDLSVPAIWVGDREWRSTPRLHCYLYIGWNLSRATLSGTMLTKLVVALGALLGARAAPQGAVSTGVPSITLSTVIASPTAPLTNPLPTQVPLPPVQPWCPSEIFCAGSLLQTVNIAGLYVDPKTFVDKPTVKSSQQVLTDFQSVAGNGSETEGSIENFVNTDFKGEGLELEAVALPSFNTNPAFLNNISDPLLKAWSQTVHGFWTQLIRSTNDSTLCGQGGNDCESSLIPLNHSFVVPGGRFREQYYWDSYWIVQGLLKSELFSIVNDTLQNFMDELEHIGFIPNGGRIYYLNRSQPPLFIHMLQAYVEASGDASILTRALPLAEKELTWWSTNRTISVTSPYSGKTYSLFRYAVNNTAPRPESYLTDYLTANDPTLTTPLSDDERAELYSELASGAETGWDYCSRFIREPLAGGSNNTNPALRTLNVKGHVPIDLNSILYRSHLILAGFYNNQSHSAAAANHTTIANDIKAGILDLMWDANKLAFYDFNLTANARNSIFTVATFYPLWNGIVPTEVASSTQNAFGFFSSLNMVLNKYNGTFPVTFIETGLQWDAPNSWPPHQFIVLEALRNLPSNVTSGTLPTPSLNQSTFDLIPQGQINLFESQLPGQPLNGFDNATKTGPGADINKLNGTVFNGGNASGNEGWAFTLQRELANRYFASALCSWYVDFDLFS
ncbi:Trehalase, partial [Abortiporus biennis]